MFLRTWMHCVTMKNVEHFHLTFTQCLSGSFLLFWKYFNMLIWKCNQKWVSTDKLPDTLSCSKRQIIFISFTTVFQMQHVLTLGLFSQAWTKNAFYLIFLRFLWKITSNRCLQFSFTPETSAAHSSQLWQTFNGFKVSNSLHCFNIFIYSYI